MKLHTEPAVRLIAATAERSAAVLEYLEGIDARDWSTDAASGGEFVAELAGRVCYRSFYGSRRKTNREYLDHILAEGHGSVAEHAHYVLLLTGVSRTLAMELIRHRHLSFSMRSQRYCDDSEIGFVVPPALAEAVAAAGRYVARFGEPHPSAADALDYAMRHEHIPEVQPAAAALAGLNWRAAMEAASAAYGVLSAALASEGGIPLPGGGVTTSTASRKRAREAARAVLPGCTATEIVVSGNARAFRGVIEQRGAAGADAEFQRLALAILAALQRESPNLFADYSTEGGVITTPYKKV